MGTSKKYKQNTNSTKLNKIKFCFISMETIVYCILFLILLFDFYINCCFLHSEHQNFLLCIKFQLVNNYLKDIYLNIFENLKYVLYIRDLCS